MIYAFLNQKGGVGKTTLALHVADALARSGLRVLFVDADPQQSALKWSAMRSEEGGFSVVGMAKATLHKEMTQLAEGYDAVVIDAPPRVTDIARSVVLAADLVVIPVQPSPVDVWATAETVDLIADAQTFKPSLRGVITLNRRIVNTAISKAVREALETLGLPVLKSEVGQRVAFPEALASGSTVAGLQPNSVGAREIVALVKELEETINGKKESEHIGKATSRK